jgi:hypothetical protein
MNINGAQIN